MTDQVVTHPGRTEEPQCYNCGGMGHWAVACPEPTRETPAGLAAWRNASATRQGSGRAQHNDGRKSKGPIITKYGPPPPPTGYGAHYPPPPVYPPPHNSYTVMGNNHCHPLRQAMDTIRLPLTLLLLSLTLPSSHGPHIRDHRKNTAVIPTQDKTAINSSHLGQLTADHTRKVLEVAISVIINGHSRLTETLHRHRQSLALFM
ncbi:hypothetical protein ACQRIT_004620 [Beauveria bassiana]